MHSNIEELIAQYVADTDDLPPAIQKIVRDTRAAAHSGRALDVLRGLGMLYQYSVGRMPDTLL